MITLVALQRMNYEQMWISAVMPVKKEADAIF